MKEANIFKEFKNSFLRHRSAMPGHGHGPGCPVYVLVAWLSQSQIPTKFIPTQPESNTTTVNIKKMEFPVHYAVFRQVPCLISKNNCKKSNNFGFFSRLRHTFYRRASKLLAKGWCTCNLQCFDHVYNLLFNICHCPKIFIFRFF